jgi:hypothetical protein
MKTVSRKNRFGYVKYHPKPVTEADFKKVFARHEYLVPGVAELTVRLSRRGGGVAGLRRFRFDILPAVDHHNDLTAAVQVEEEQTGVAELDVVMVSSIGKREVCLFLTVLCCRKTERDTALNVRD